MAKISTVRTCFIVLGVWALAGCSSDSPVTCNSHAKTICSQDVTYWYDDCGNKEEIAESCKCGCNATYASCKDCNSPTPDGGTSPDGQLTDGPRIVSDGACVPNCAGKECGDDGCGGECGPCTNGKSCSSAFKCEGSVTADLLTIGCDVPYVLQASKISDLAYMATHFAHLVQQYCITGLISGVNITTYNEKMFYGQHDASTTLSLVQTSLTAALAPAYSVKIDFNPDTSVKNNSIWPVGIAQLNPNEASVAVIRYDGLSPCLWRIGTAGQLKFTKVKDVTLTEGGAFEASGTAKVDDPWNITGFCSETGAELPCCGN